MPTHDEKLTIEQGSDFRHTFTAMTDQGQARNLTGWKARGVVRQYAEGAVLYELPLRLSAGRIQLTIPGRDSGLWTWKIARYEVKLFGPKGQQERFAAGDFAVDPQLVYGEDPDSTQ